MSGTNRSYLDENGNGHYAKTGRYNEVTTGAVNSVPNHSIPAFKQNLVKAGNSAAKNIIGHIGAQPRKLSR